LVLLRGESGSGKSTILLAIAYVLDILPSEYSAVDLQDWNSDAGMQVNLTLEIDGKSFVFGRGKKNFIKGEGLEVSGAGPVKEKQIELLGFHPDVLKALVYRDQDNPKLFVNLSPGYKIEFLTEVLGLKSIEEAVDKADKKIKELEKQKETVDSNLGIVGTQLTDIRSLKPTDVPDIAAFKTKFASVSERHDLAKNELASVTDKLKELRDHYKQNHANEIKDLEEKLKAVDDKYTETAEKIDVVREQHRNYLTGLRDRIQHLDEALKAITFSKERLVGHQKELDIANKNVCAWCMRPWDQIQEKRAHLVEVVESLKKNIAGEEVFKQERDKTQVLYNVNPRHPDEETLKEACKKLWTIKETLSNKINDLKNGGNTEEKQALENQREVLINKCIDIEREALDAKATLKVKENAYNNALHYFNLHKDKIKELERQVAELEATQRDIETNLNAEKDFSAMMGREGFLGTICTEVLNEIAVEANSRLGLLDNVSHVSLEFKTEKESSKGNVQRKIHVCVYVGGKLAKFKTGLSGGMQTSVSQVIDLAVMNVISRRAGKVLGWLALDEVFNGQNNKTKEAALEVLKEFAREKLVLVIDHSSELKESFSKTIDVVCENGKSRIE
jgi:DNA repair exonuclease SbcCD ATPase subunit